MPTRRKFSGEFKREAVQMTLVPGATIREVAGDLGISEGLLGRWERDLQESGEKAFLGRGHARDEELMALKRDLGRVTKERDFLAEAAAENTAGEH